MTSGEKVYPNGGQETITTNVGSNEARWIDDNVKVAEWSIQEMVNSRTSFLNRRRGRD